MDEVLSIVSRICKPTSNGLENQVDQDTMKKNKIFFWTLFLMTVMQPVTSQFSSLPASANQIIIVCNIMNLLFFVLLCRSYLWVFYTYFTLMASFCPIILMNAQKDMMFAYLGFSITVPALVFAITSNLYCMGLAAAMQVVTSLTTFKRIFKEMLQETDHDAFTEQFINVNIMCIVFMAAILTTVFSMLKTKTDALSQAHKAVQEALDHQKTFVFSFSHELRNPINSLLGNLQLLLMSNNISPEAREMVRTAKICGELLLQLINNVLDAGKRDVGKLEVSPIPTKVHDLFQRIWAVSNDLIVRKQLKSHLKIEKKVPPILLLDSHRLNQVMMNLIGNAVKFTESGSITITVKWLERRRFTEKSFDPIPYDDDGLFEKEENFNMITLNSGTQQTEEHLVLNKIRKEFTLEEIESPTRASNGVLKIMVRDTGCGMSADALGSLFQKFSQVSNDTSKRQIGTGLGLFITKEICRQMDGDARGYSKPGAGSTFVVCIPTSSINSSSQIHLGKSISQIQSDLSQKKLKVMVADDSPFNVNLVCNFFSKLNALVVGVACDGFDAYKKYMEKRENNGIVDVVTLDIDMPRMDGKIACKKIREYERQKNLVPAKIILISGNYDEQQVNDFLDSCNEKRADYFLKKPLIFEEFCLALYRIQS